MFFHQVKNGASDGLVAATSGRRETIDVLGLVRITFGLGQRCSQQRCCEKYERNCPADAKQTHSVSFSIDPQPSRVEIPCRCITQERSESMVNISLKIMKASKARHRRLFHTNFT